MESTEVGPTEVGERRPAAAMLAGWAKAAWPVAIGIVAVACAGNIPNTEVPDTDENREVVKFMEKYRRAVESREVGSLLSMASHMYLDDNGTPNGDDDLDFGTLKKKLSRWSEQVSDVRYEIKYRRVTVEPQKVLVEFRYSSSFKVASADGEPVWRRRLGDHRMVLERMSSGEFRILSGM